MRIHEAEQLHERDGGTQKIKRSSRSSRYRHPSTHFVNKSCRNKRRYHTEEEAADHRRRIENAIKANGNVPDVTRCYACAVCGGFHLTGIID